MDIRSLGTGVPVGRERVGLQVQAGGRMWLKVKSRVIKANGN